MVFLVLMAVETGLARGDRPSMRPMTGGASPAGMVALFVELPEVAVAGLAIDHRLDLCLLEMARLAGHLHHGGRSIDSVAGDAVQGRPIACPVAKAAEDSSVNTFQRPWVPGLRARRRSGSEGKERPALRHRVAYRALTGKRFAFLAYMAIIMASEAAGPVAMTDVVGISRPVYFHGWKNITVINPEDGVDRLF